MKTISVLFSTYTDFPSKIIKLLSHGEHTHVSLAIDDKNEYFYAFNTKGFRKEYPKKHKNRTKNNICYKLKISDAQYKKLTTILQEFKKKESTSAYNWLGLIFCIFRLRIHRKENKCFCSQFIARILERAEILKLKKHSGKYLPYQLKREIDNSPLVIEKIVNCFPC